MLLSPNIGEIGIDESGRGTLWGNVVAAAVMLPAEREPWMDKLNDSKKLSAKSRAELESLIKERCRWGIGEASAEEIDGMNILRATMTAMHRAIDALGELGTNAHLMIDGTYFIRYKDLEYTCVPGGDAKFMSIAAASILAKEHRDRSVLQLCNVDPELKTKYMMDRHKGYGTKAHIEAVKLHGPHTNHRRTFSPISSHKDSCSN